MLVLYAIKLLKPHCFMPHRILTKVAAKAPFSENQHKSWNNLYDCTLCIDHRNLISMKPICLVTGEEGEATDVARIVPSHQVWTVHLQTPGTWRHSHCRPTHERPTVIYTPSSRTGYISWNMWNINCTNDRDAGSWDIWRFLWKGAVAWNRLHFWKTACIMWLGSVMNTRISKFHCIPDLCISIPRMDFLIWIPNTHVTVQCNINHLQAQMIPVTISDNIYSYNLL